MKKINLTVMNMSMYIYMMTMMPTMTTMMDTTYLTDTTMMTTETLALDSYNLIGFPIVQDFYTVKGFRN